MSWRGTRGLSTALLVAAIGGGCHGAARDTVPTQPFRDEVEPGDGFQYTESATPAGEGDRSSSGSSSETTVEIEIDEESSDGVDEESSDAEPEADEDASDEGGGDEEGEEGEDDGAARGVTRPGD